MIPRLVATLLERVNILITHTHIETHPTSLHTHLTHSTGKVKLGMIFSKTHDIHVNDHEELRGCAHLMVTKPVRGSISGHRYFKCITFG